MLIHLISTEHTLMRLYQLATPTPCRTIFGLSSRATRTRLVMKSAFLIFPYHEHAMKMNETTAYLAVHSPLAVPSELRAAVDRICAARPEGNQWVCSRFPWPSGEVEVEDDWFHFNSMHLPSLRPFHVCDANSRIWQVAVGSESKCDVRLLAATLRRFRALDHATMRAASIELVSRDTFFTQPVEIESSCRWQEVKRPYGYQVTVRLRTRCTSTATRLEFVKRSIGYLGVESMVRIEGDEKQFLLRPAEGWSLYILEDERPPYYDPDFVKVGAFFDFEHAWCHIERFRESEFGQDLKGIEVHLVMNPQVYESTYDQLNELANDWVISFLGRYADSTDPYTADGSLASDGRFPVVRWTPVARENREVYQANILVTSGGRVLEVIGNCGDMNQLLAEASNTTGLDFQPALIE